MEYKVKLEGVKPGSKIEQFFVDASVAVTTMKQWGAWGYTVHYTRVRS